MAEQEQRWGCLFFFLRFLRLRKTAALPTVPTITESPRYQPPKPRYRLRDDFLSPAEASFYHLLHRTVGDRALVFTKVRLGDLIYPPHQPGKQAAWNRINHKHVDFVLCDPQTLRPLLAIELDDRSHQRPERRDRDQFVDDVCRDAGLGLERVPARRSYETHALQERIEQWLTEAQPIRAVSARSDAPSEIQPARRCERCGGEMRRRQASHGVYAGQFFWGCSNYPHCRHVVPIEAAR